MINIPTLTEFGTPSVIGAIFCLFLSLLFALLYGFRFNKAEPGWQRTAVKTLAIAALAFGAVLLNAPGLLVLALIASAAGDCFLAIKGQTFFLAGVASFALAHVFFVALFFQLGAGLANATALSIGFMVVVVVAGAALLFGVLWSKLGAMKGPLTGYFAIIMMMTILALMLPVGLPQQVIAIGAIVFALSDMILGYELFALTPESSLRKYTSPSVWTLYCSAQWLITFGVVLATSAV